MDSKKSTDEIHFRIPKELKEKVEGLAAKAGLTTSAYIKLLIHNALN